MTWSWIVAVPKTCFKPLISAPDASDRLTEVLDSSFLSEVHRFCPLIALLCTFSLDVLGAMLLSSEFYMGFVFEPGMFLAQCLPTRILDGSSADGFKDEGKAYSRGSGEELYRGI